MRSRFLLAASALIVTFALYGAVVRSYVLDVTSHGRDRELWDISLPTLDVGIDIHVAKPGRSGYLDLWLFWHRADDITPLFHVPGAPAAPLPPPFHSTNMPYSYNKSNIRTIVVRLNPHLFRR